MSRILVTGGAGFIGSHIVDALITCGHRVVIVDNLSRGKKKNVNPKAKFYKIDIRDKKLENIFKKEKPNFVCHHAAHIDLRESVRDPIFDAENNIIGSLNILQNCVKYKIKKIIFASTGGALYGEAKIIPTPETYPAMPVSPYGAAKLSIEHYLHYYFKMFGLSYATLRYGNVYGPRQDGRGEAGVVAIFAEKMLTGKQPTIFGDGCQTRDYVFVGDVVRANLLAVQSKKIGFYNVGTGAQISVNQLFKKLVKITGIRVKEIHGPAALGEQKRSCLSFAKIRRELGWKPNVALDEGLQRTVAWFKSKIT
jgi:UDP-glucose 4-epimerase